MSIGKLIERTEVIYIEFLDLEKAFDNFDWSIMFPTLQKIEFAQKT